MVLLFRNGKVSKGTAELLANTLWLVALTSKTVSATLRCSLAGLAKADLVVRLISSCSKVMNSRTTKRHRRALFTWKALRMASCKAQSRQLIVMDVVEAAHVSNARVYDVYACSLLLWLPWLCQIWSSSSYVHVEPNYMILLVATILLIW